jgi:hypothetical protein
MNLRLESIPLSGWSGSDVDALSWEPNQHLLALFAKVSGTSPETIDRPIVTSHGRHILDDLGLPSRAELFRALTLGQQSRYICAVTSGSRHPELSYTLGGRGFAEPDDLTDAHSLFDLYRAGATIEFQRTERFFPTVRTLARAISVAVNGAVQVSTYLTPARQQAYDRHFDPYDVLVVQISGAKRWRIWEPTWQHPLPHQNSTWLDSNGYRPAASTDAPRELTLEAGDVLWLPRGWHHEVATVENNSVHLSFIASPLTVMDALAASLNRAQEDAELRVRMPAGQVDGRVFAEAVSRLQTPLWGLVLQSAAPLSPSPRFGWAEPGSVVDAQSYLATARDGNNSLIHFGDHVLRAASPFLKINADGSIFVNFQKLTTNELELLSMTGLLA